MCTPLAIVAVALTAGSVIANKQAADAQAKARSGALAAESARQNQYQQEAEALNKKSADEYSDFSDKLGSKQQELNAQLKAQVANDLPTGQTTQETATSPLPSSGSNIVNQEIGKQKAKANAYSDQQAGALANLRSFGDLMGENALATARNDALIGNQQSFMRGSAAVLPAELQAANNAGSGWRMAGTIMGGLGSLAGMGAGAGLGGAAGLATPSTTELLNTPVNAASMAGDVAGANSAVAAANPALYSGLAGWFNKKLF